MYKYQQKCHRYHIICICCVCCRNGHRIVLCYNDNERTLAKLHSLFRESREHSTYHIFCICCRQGHRIVLCYNDTEKSTAKLHLQLRGIPEHWSFAHCSCIKYITMNHSHRPLLRMQLWRLKYTVVQPSRLIYEVL